MSSSQQKIAQPLALNVEELSFSYHEKPALSRVNFALSPAQCAILLGLNGAGKSTLFALITHLYDTRHGNISLCGLDLKKHTRQALSRLGVVFQQTTLDLDLTVKQNLRYHTALHGMSRKTANQRIQEELERLAMYERQHEKIRQLNGGHRRRVEIARALLHKPALLLLDEPTVGLDIASRDAIVSHVHQLASDGIAVLWATHLIDEIYPQDQVIILHQGKVLQQGTSEALMKASNTASINAAFQTFTQPTAA